MPAPVRAPRRRPRSWRWRSCESGKGVQAFPEYGPERRGAPLRAFTRVADRPIRRHDTITDPDVVVVLEPSLVHEAGDRRRAGAGRGRDLQRRGGARRARGPWTSAACRRPGSPPSAALAFVNMVMLGAVAAALGEPALGELQDAAVETLGRKVPAADVRGAFAEGYEWLS